ncbi:13178_t:CDS:2, partial [Ambispora leptoticha]
GEDYNVIIEVGKSPNTKEFKTHTAILKFRSLYFRNELTKKEVLVGVLSLENLEASSIFDIMLVACEFHLEELVKHLETHLINAEAHWLRSR